MVNMNINRVIHRPVAALARVGRCARGRVRLVAMIVLAAGTPGFVTGADESPDPAAVSVDGPEDASAYLEFENKLDGKCYILSSGGKLTLMHNRHPERAIRYRLMRVFAGRPQGSFAVGTLAAGAEPIKLGCSEVDGRPQEWTVVRAEFAPDDTAPSAGATHGGSDDTPTD